MENLTLAQEAFSNDFYNMREKICSNCDVELVPNDVVEIDGSKINCLLCYMTAHSWLNDVALFSKLLKVALGCRLSNCAGYPEHSSALDWAHIDATTKYKTKSGKIVEPSDLFYNCSARVFVAEVRKCYVWCSNCHRVSTANERGLKSHAK